MSLMEIFSNPDTINTLSFGDKMLASTITMVMGMGITFLILILIWIFIAIMGKCLNTADKSKKKEVAAPAVQAADAAPSGSQVATASDSELVAVIAAAVAAYQGANASQLVVRKITRLSGDNTPWGVSALEDRLETRKF